MYQGILAHHLYCFVDVSDIKFVINFDYPNCSEDYVHRIGRTARAEQSGTAYTFFTPDNSKQAKDLVDVLREAKQQINPKLQQLADNARDFGKGKTARKTFILFFQLSFDHNNAPLCQIR